LYERRRVGLPFVSFCLVAGSILIATPKSGDRGACALAASAGGLAVLVVAVSLDGVLEHGEAGGDVLVAVLVGPGAQQGGEGWVTVLTVVFPCREGLADGG
jgi:hypothetical protein